MTVRDRSLIATAGYCLATPRWVQRPGCDLPLWSHRNWQNVTYRHLAANKTSSAGSTHFFRGGVHPDRVGPLPPLNDLPSPDGDTHTAIENPAIIWHPPFPWPVPATTAATAWREYLETGGTLPLLIIGRHADAVASAPSVSSVLDECSRIGGRWHTRKVLPGRRLDRLLDRAQILWNPSVADDGHWLVARALARGIPAVVADAPHLLNDGPRVDTIPMLRTYAAHDIVAAGAALLAASTDPPVAGLPSPHLSPVSVPTVSWRETLDTLQLHAYEC
jgi:hypothetical protein